MPKTMILDGIQNRTGVQTVDTFQLRRCFWDEESEEVLFSQRTKLIHVRDTGWEDKGLGDAKLLFPKKSGLVR